MAIEGVPFKRAVRALMPPLSIRHSRPGVALIDLFQLRPDLTGVPAFLKLRLASSSVATRSDRVIGPFTISDQNQRKLSGPPRVWEMRPTSHSPA